MQRPITYGMGKLMTVLVKMAPLANDAIEAHPNKSGPGLYVVELVTADQLFISTV